MLALKARKRTISIQPWFAFVAMEKHGDFGYEVLLGDPEGISGELERANKEQKQERRDQILLRCPKRRRRASKGPFNSLRLPI